MPPRRTTPTPPAPVVLTEEQLTRGIVRLERRLNDLENFDPNTVPERWHPNVKALETSINQTLDAVFGHDTIERRRYGGAGSLDNGPILMSTGFGRAMEPDFRPYLVDGKAAAIALLNQGIEWLREELDERGTQASPDETPSRIAPAKVRSNSVFIVHGRADGPKEAVARLLEKLNLKAIILHEQANAGRTVIEKIEAFGDVGFAVVLLTPDDIGALLGGEPRPRARQNVVLELGYFLGKLGRANVCTLAVERDTLDLPSDWGGVIDEPFDAAGRWRFTLARELRAAGYEVDLNVAADM